MLFYVRFNIFVYIKNNKEFNISLYISDPGDAAAFLIENIGTCLLNKHQERR